MSYRINQLRNHQYGRIRKNTDLFNIIKIINVYTYCELNARSVGQVMDRVFSSFYGPGVKRVGHENKEGKNEDP